MNSKKNIAIIGAGYTGIAAALDLSKAGYEVTMFEADEDVGGLAGSFEISPGIKLEKFYHHWFSSDTHIISLLRELGLGDKIKTLQSNTGLYFANSTFRLSKPLDLLSFTPLPFIDRVRTGVMVVAARLIDNWRKLESETAISWILKYAGRKSYEVIWEPLLKGKFGSEAPHISAVWFWNKLKLRGGSRGKDGSENLLYFDGGFGGASAWMKKNLTDRGITIHTHSPVKKILTQNGKVSGILTDKGTFECDRILATLPLPCFFDITPDLPESFTKKPKEIRFLGNVCIVLRMNRSLSSTYWLNVADPSFPFVGVIEHTNFDPPENYAGEKIAYLSKYLPVSDEMFSWNDQKWYEYCLPYVQKIFPEFSSSWVNGYHVWRAHYSQPVITQHYSELIPDEKTPIENLWLSTMAQVYPEDRGTNYAIRHGRAVARKIIDNDSTL